MTEVILTRVNIDDELKIYMLDVSQGDGIVMITPDDKVILIDGGSSDEGELYKYRLEPFLKYKGIRKIDYIMISHMDIDHISGVIDLLEDDEIKVKNIFLPVTEKNKGNNIEKIVRKLKTCIRFIKAGDKLNINDVQFIFLHPSFDYYGVGKNAYSMTFLLKYKSFDMLFTGDLEADGEQIVCKKLKNYIMSNKIDVVKVPHHGSKNSSTYEFVKLMRPTYAFISAGKNNRYGHPHRETVERYRDVKSKIFITSKVGMISLVSDGKSVNVSTKK